MLHAEQRTANAPSNSLAVVCVAFNFLFISTPPFEDSTRRSRIFRIELWIDSEYFFYAFGLRADLQSLAGPRLL
jgi:hypothetical protein